ncbi:MAG: ribosomal protein S18-alanine N-acetyltransferase [Halothiobacillaceae bacterium]|jgi:ribosomal-protein-alanine N-acetyltransferase|nr:ribosomal protein S18-alanine N-acetyltransferase [Halothiobacillaceae bacterium]
MRLPYRHPLSIRSIREDDLPAIMAVEVDAYPFPWSEGLFRDCLAAGYDGWLVHERGDVVAYAIVMRVIDEAHLLNLCVAPHWQGQGIGRALIEWLKKQLSGAGAVSLWLEVRESNTVAQTLYEHSGFMRVGERKGYYPAGGGRENAHVMSLTLPVAD